MEVLTTCLTFSGGTAISIWVNVVGMSILIAQFRPGGDEGTADVTVLIGLDLFVIRFVG